MMAAIYIVDVDVEPIIAAQQGGCPFEDLKTLLGCKGCGEDHFCWR